MTKEKIRLIAMYAKPEEVRRWEENAKGFVDNLHPHVISALKTACDACPFRNNISVGGCGGKECPVYAVIDSLMKVSKRARATAKRIHETKIGLKAKEIYG